MGRVRAEAISYQLRKDVRVAVDLRQPSPGLCRSSAPRDRLSAVALQANVTEWHLSVTVGEGPEVALGFFVLKQGKPAERRGRKVTGLKELCSHDSGTAS